MREKESDRFVSGLIEIEGLFERRSAVETGKTIEEVSLHSDFKCDALVADQKGGGGTNILLMEDGQRLRRLQV